MFSLEALADIRRWEIERIAGYFRPGARILEIGAGTGQQALDLANRGFDVEAIEVPDSLYAGKRLFPIKDYDGLTIPFPDRSFDVVYSSNVLEHVPDLVRIYSEIRRVLKADGYIVHVLPTHAWRFWSMISAVPRAIQGVRGLKTEISPRRPFGASELRRLRTVWLDVGRHVLSPCLQHRHGARGNVLSEMWFFHPNWWRRNFKANGFLVERELPMGLFYTGNLVMGRRWDTAKRSRLARFLGSACHVFVLRPS